MANNLPQCFMGVDEFTVVLFRKHALENINQWSYEAQNIIKNFVELTQIEPLLGKIIDTEVKKPAGCTDAKTLKDVPWYLAFGWHRTNPNMGVIVRFSAYAWAMYQRRFEEKYATAISIAGFLQLCQSEYYRTRLSRIDIVADYFNYGEVLNPNTIYEKIKNQQLKVVDYRERRSNRKYGAVANNWQVETFYIGSKKENSGSKLRIYDKRAEQIQRHGFRLSEAKKSESWTRFEVSYRNKYAHQITAALLEIETDATLAQFLASKILDKYRFVDEATDTYIPCTELLLQIVNQENFAVLRSEQPENNQLKQDIANLLHHSNLMSILYKVHQLWGEAEVQVCIDYLLIYYWQVYRFKAASNYRLMKWIRENTKSMEGQNIKICFEHQGIDQYI